MDKTDINKFNWPQIFNDATGKTSATLFSGVIIIISSAGGFISAGLSMMIVTLFKLQDNANMISFYQTLVMQSIAFAAIGAALLGVHRLSKDHKVDEDVIQ